MGLEMKFRSHGATSATLPHEDDRALVGMFMMTVQMFVLYRMNSRDSRTSILSRFTLYA